MSNASGGSEPFVSPALRKPVRSFEQILAEAEAELKRLPLTSPRRAEVIRTIRWVQDEIDRRGALSDA